MFEFFRASSPSTITRSAHLSKRIMKKNAPLKNSKRHPPCKKRTTHLICHAKNVCIKREKYNTSFKSQPKLLPEINANIVHGFEPHPPRDEGAVEWSW
jgi:hypothetical protein